MQMMRAAAASMALTALAGTVNAQVDFWLTVLHNNDGESQLINAGSGLEDFGGIARFKTLADNLKAEAMTFPPSPAEHGVVMISSGDNFLAGPEFNASLQSGVPFFDTIGMQLIGYDAAAIGNHEFDFGPDVLEDFIAGFNPPLTFLSANLDFSNEPGLLAQVNSGRIASSTVVTVGTKQVGIVGATTDTLPFVSSPRNTIINADIAAAVQAEVDDLTNQGVDIIILTSHLQGIQEEFDLLPMISGVDVVIAGGGGELIANPGDLLVPGDMPFSQNIGGTGYPRANMDMLGNTVPIVTTSGDYKYIGRLIVGFDAAGNVVDVDTASGPVRVSGIAPDAVAPDPTVQAQVVDPVLDSIMALGNNVIADQQVDLDGRRSQVREVETNEGNLCADSLLWAGNEFAALFGVNAPDVALQNGGGIRNDTIIPAGDFTELETFDILPFANFVSIVEDIPAAQFKEILENAVSAVTTGNGRFAQVAGFRFAYDPALTAQVIDPGTGMITTAGERVREVVLNDGTFLVKGGEVVMGAPDVNISIVDFLARGGDQYPFNGAPFTTIGISYQAALREYIETGLGGVITAEDYPVGGEGRIVIGDTVFVCYADCSVASGVGVLDIFDFLCFQDSFVAGNAYADCDGNTVLDIFDFLCFQDAFVIGCP